MMNWDKCREFQKNLKNNLVLDTPEDTKFNKLAAFDISFKKNYAFAIALIYNIKDNKIDKIYKNYFKNSIKYVPTFLAFREIPYLLRLINEINGNYDLILCDGHGIMHPYRSGLATHLGYLLDKPSIGVAKSYLCGEFEEPDEDFFSKSTVYDKKGKRLGYALTNRKKTKPIFISPGYKISFEKSLKLIRIVSGKYRVPEPLHVADRISKKYRKEFYDRKRT
ncbi:MAG TPA: endonuclease V [Candidatus Mcinerneyibacterium sp.]|nr:endonuclease V [Candidatus Mcinerneyibacterium sp.]